LKQYRTAKIIFPFSIILIFIVGINIEENTFTRRTFFPYYSHMLFPTPHKTVIDYGVVISQVNGVIHPRKIDIMELEADNFAIKAFTPYWPIQDLGNALEGRSGQDPKELRKNFEKKFLSIYSSVQYDVVKRSWDPIESWNSRPNFAYKTVLIVGSYVYP
jgi:hypothetical protein